MAFPLLEKLHTRFLWLGAVQSWVAKVGTPVVVTSLTLTGLILGIRHLELFQSAELSAYDHFIQMQPRQGKDDRLLIVGIDEVDLQTLQEWPISDRTLTQTIQQLEAHQAKAIGLDVMRDIPFEPGRQDLLRQLQQTKQVVIVCKVNSQREFGTAPPPGIPINKIGTADLVIDPGGILRRALLWLSPPESGLVIKKHPCNDPNNSLLSFSSRLAFQYLESLNIKPEITPAGDLKIGAALFPKFQPNTGGYRNADAGGYQLLLRYRSETNVAPQVRLTDVLSGKVSPDLIRDRIVLVGYTTPQAKDDFYTPYSSGKRDMQKMPGVVVHAQAVSQILSAVLDNQRLIWVLPIPGELIWILGWSLVGGVLAWYCRHPFWFTVVVTGVSGAIYTISLLVFFQSGWLPVVPAIASFISTAVGVVLFDRFNNSAYGQTVYRTVKTFLKLEVDIDEEKLEKQVAEITETDYFRDLQDTVKSLREQPLNPKAGSESPDTAKNLAPSTSEDYEFDFFQQLKQESNQLKKSSASLPTDPSQAGDELNGCQTPQTTSQPSEALELPDLQAAPYSSESQPKQPPYQKFTLDDYSFKTPRPLEDLDYLEDWQQQIQQLKKSKPEEETL